MDGAVDQIILLPRFSSFGGAGTFLGAPMNVREYGRAILTCVKAGALGSTPATLAASVQESADLEIWTDIGSALTDGVPGERAFRFEWIRMKYVVVGTDPGVTCWCVGDFVQRHP